MVFFITGNEPSKIKSLFSDAIETPMDFDFLLCTSVGQISIERKAIPGDLLSSITDGRLQKEIIAMREVSSFPIVLFHGIFEFHQDGSLIMPGVPKRNRKKAAGGWTYKGIRNFRRTLEYVEGVHVEDARDDKELVEVVNELQKYFDQQHHLSLKGRARLEPEYIVSTRAEKVRNFYQGIPEISVIRAKALCEAFSSPVKLYRASVQDILNIQGFGEKLANHVYNFLREG